MNDLGAPSSYLALRRGAHVYDSHGERIGEVDHVLADPGADIFEGLILDTRPLLGAHRFADADQCDAIYERGVVLKVGREELHDPTASPAVLDADPADAEASRLGLRLRRAWDWISGNY